MVHLITGPACGSHTAPTVSGHSLVPSTQDFGVVEGSHPCAVIARSQQTSLEGIKGLLYEDSAHLTDAASF